MSSLEFIEEITRNANAVQEKLLGEILTQNAKTEYLRGFNLEGACDAKSIFKSKIPMITYQDIQPFIRRIADGDRSPILTSTPISELLISSGTSGGERKLIPSTKESADRKLFVIGLLKAIMKMHVKEEDKGKALYFMLTKAVKKTEGGLTAQSDSSSLFKRLVVRPEAATLLTSPSEAVLCPDSFQSLYTQLLCGLYHRHQVVRIGASFAYGLLWAINFLKLNWQQLAHDIKTGTLNPQVTDVSIRDCMAPLMRPHPDLAAFIAHQCGNDDNWEGIIARLWPNAKYLDTIVTGSMAQYIPALDYYSGGLPKASKYFASSEGYHAINLNPLCSPYEVAYTIMPNMSYFEFLPCGVESSKEHLVDLVDVEVGNEYEMVITTAAGLYRYRTGDVLRVVGFHNSSPEFKFVRRENAVLSVDAEKTTEVQLQAAVDSACRLLSTRVVDYTTCADTKSFPGHYVVYWEMQGERPGEEVMGQCCLAMEESLDGMYRAFRVLHKSIGPLEIRVVRKGTFEEVAEYAVSRGSSIAQYKVPRCINSKPILDLLDSRVVSSHFSPSLPSWTLESVLKD